MASTALATNDSTPDTLSTEIIARWEAENECSAVDKKHKSDVLKKLLRRCGLSTSMSVPAMRTVLLSLKKVELPACPTEVVRLLKMRNEAIGGID